MKEMTVGEPSEQLYRMVPLSLDNAEIASRDVSVEDRAYVNGARQAQSIAHQSLIALDKWIADGCGNRIATLKSTGLLKEIEDAQRTTAEMPDDLKRSLAVALVAQGAEYCGNWPCRLLKYHTGPCSSSERTNDE